MSSHITTLWGTLQTWAPRNRTFQSPLPTSTQPLEVPGSSWEPKASSQLLNLEKGESSCVEPNWRSGMAKPKPDISAGSEQSSRGFPWCRSATNPAWPCSQTAPALVVITALCWAGGQVSMSQSPSLILTPSPSSLYSSCPFAVTIYLWGE